MFKSVSISLAALMIAAPALAGGPAAVVVEPVAIVEVPPVVLTDWAGAYVGGNVNWGKGAFGVTGDTADAFEDAGYGTTLVNADGTSIALRAGYDWQMGQGVFGVGGEVNLGKYEGDIKSEFANVDGDTSLADLSFSIEKMVTLYGRAGYAASDKFLAYGLLGYSWADGSFSLNGNNATKTMDGATIGLGGEYRFSDAWSGYGEYAYTNFGEISGSDGQFEADLSQVKLGVNYRF